MYHEPPFQNRVDAGRILADGLKQYRGSDSLVFAVPRGGIPVAVEVAKKLGSNLDIIVPRKIPIPDNPEAGYGAGTEDGVIASGYTMMAAIRSIRQQGAAKVVAAAPVASSRAWELIKSSADDVVFAVISHYYPFAVASFYRHWHDLTDEEVIGDLEGFMKDYRGHAND